jgi:hypothetical protein
VAQASGVRDRVRRTINDRLTAALDPQRIDELLRKRMKPEDLRKLNDTITSAIDEAATNRWDAAVKRAAALPGDLRPEKMKALADSFARQQAAAGAAAGAAAASPLVGTAATLATALAELTWFTMRAGDLILTVAALHGRPTPTVEERRAWLLAVLIYGGSARDGFSRALNEAQTGMSVVHSNGPSRNVNVAVIQRANNVLARALVRRYGARRGVVALGTALPLGLGAVIGGGANYRAVRALAKNADQFFSRLPYASIVVDAQEVAGAVGPSPSDTTRLR